MITNLQPDTLLRLGLCPEAVREFNPGIIYVSLTSCGWDDRFRGVRMDDGAAQAASGLALSTGWPDSGPVLVPVPIGATVSALFGAIAVAAAWARGSATSVDCALLDSLAMCLEFPLMQAATFDKVPAKNGGRHPTSSPSQPFKTKDGFLAIMATSNAHVRTLLTALSLDELADDERFSSYAGRLQNRDELEAKIETELMRETTLSWFEKLSALGIACAPMQTLPEAVAHAKAHDYSTIRPLSLRGRPIDTVAMPGGRAARGLEETAAPIEVQDAGWCGPQALRPLQKACTLLSGVRVLDLTRFLSGPFATFLLSELGAHVLKIEPPGGDPTRQFSPLLEGQSGYFTSINRGKRTLEIDLKTQAGRDWLLSELARTDILIENYRPGVMKRFGLTESVLKARNPKLVTVSISGYGSERTFADRAAFDMTMQAFTGIMTQT
ncbi:CoA transferase, partial [Roseibium sp.]|uniref:CoA transferase n=1 Tax=Roseibium sp. TaxID=1936156 RepID=UPI003A97CFD3